MENNTDTVYKRIAVTWYSPTGAESSLTLRNKTRAEAIKEAYYFGWRPPKWWQFWKSKEPIIVASEV